MRIGILTFHSQLNYGGVLQAWALQKAVEQILQETSDKTEENSVEIIDRWMNSTNGLLGQYDNWRIKDWAKYWIRVVLGLGDQRIHRRVIRTKDFISRYMKRTPYHFYQWNEVQDKSDKEKPGVRLPDLIIVGSDQVWNPRWAHTRFYLGESFPDIPRIAYAASIGVKSLDDVANTKHWKQESVTAVYQGALEKFKAISCREQEACDIVKGLGIDAVHVVDPVLLLTREKWIQLVTKHSKEKTLLCYFISEDVVKALEKLERFAKEQHCIVEILIDKIWEKHNLPFPNTTKKAKQWLSCLTERLVKYPHIRIVDDAGPLEFLNLHADATWSVTDSFHSLMFSCIFGKNCRVLSPKNTERQGMFSRIEEINTHTLKGKSLMVKELQEALNSFRNNEFVAVDNEWITSRKEFSQRWLRNQLIK